MNGVTGCDGKQADLLYLRVIRTRRSVPCTCRAEIIARSQFLGTFPKFRIVTITSCPSSRPFVWKNSAPTGRIFMIFNICVFFENLSRKFYFD